MPRNTGSYTGGQKAAVMMRGAGGGVLHSRGPRDKWISHREAAFD